MTATFADIQSALYALPSDDRDLWVRVGMALHSELGDGGFSLFDDWSRSSDAYMERDTRDVWRSFHSGSGIGIGSLFHEARQSGWQSGQHTPAPAPAPTPTPAPAPTKPSQTADYALSLWEQADRSDLIVGAHPYALSKHIEWAAGAGRVRASGSIIGRHSDCIIVPVRNLRTFAVVAVQCINTKGAKQTFGPVSTGGFICGNTINVGLPFFVAEGWADIISLVFHHANGDAAGCASLGKGRLSRLAELVHETYSTTAYIVEDRE